MSLKEGQGEIATLPPTRVWDSPAADSGLRVSKSDVVLEPASSMRFRLVDEAYEAFCQLEERGEAVDPDEFCARYPVVHSSLARLLQAHRFLADNSQLLPEEPEPVWPALGQEWAGFRLVRELGRGAFARVFQATEPAMGNRLVALKVSPQGEREAQTLGPLDHPGIVSAYSISKDRDLFAVCMPYRGSATLVQVLDHFNTLRSQKTKIGGAAYLKACADPFADAGKPVESPAALGQADLSELTRWLAIRLTEALGFIHGKNIHHRDLKPSNILLQPDGTPLLLDFNLSADTRRQDNRLGGTPLYMAPEQLAATTRQPGQPMSLDPRSDLFSLGVILYEVVTGKHPFGPIPLKFSADALRDMLVERQEQGFVPIRKLCPEVDARLARTIESCLAQDVEKRPASAQALLDLLNQPAWLPRRAARWMIRRPKTMVAALLVSVALSTALAVVVSPRRQSEENHRQLGIDAYHGGSFQKAVGHLNLALGSNSEDREAQFLRGRALLRLGEENRENFALARQSFWEADRLGDDGTSMACIGYCTHRLGQVDLARAEYEMAWDRGLRTVAFLNNISVVWFEQKIHPKTREDLLEKSRRTLLEAVEKSNSVQAIYHNLALVYLQTAFRQSTKDRKLEYYEKGIEYAKQGLAKGPKNTDLLADCARLCVCAANVDRKWVEPALDYLEEAVKMGARLEASVKLKPGEKAGQKVEGVIYTDIYFGILKGQPRYEALLRATPMPDAYLKGVRILDPAAN